MKNKSVGSAQNGLQELTSIQNDDNANHPPTLQNIPKEKGLHSTHSFKWCYGTKTPMIVTCKTSGTVEDSLKRNHQFNTLAERNKDKELVILRDEKALTSHFPCSLLMQNDEHLTIKYIKAVDQPKKNVGVLRCKNKHSRELVMFHVLAKGGKNVTKILKNPALRKNIQEITVYAYKGEKVKQALKRDGRFLKTVFIKNCALYCKSEKVNIELSNIVDDLNDKIFQVILLNRENPSSSLDDAYLTQSQSQSQSDSEIAAHSSRTNLNGDIEPKPILQEIPNSKPIKAQLLLLFEDLVKAINSDLEVSSIKKLQVEFGQSDQMCKEVKIMKKLMELSNSVCQVRVNGSPHGSGFLIFGFYVLTNGHVVKDIYNENRNQLNEKVTVHFSYESVEPTEKEVDVVKVVGFEYNPNVPGRDWALLTLNTNQPLPVCLLKHIGFPSEDGGICIIGHPYGGVKKIDTCLIVPSQKFTQVTERHYLENQNLVQLITSRFFEGVAQSVQQQKALLYESCFYFGSSGSPVFDKNCNVIAMHTAGYCYETARGEKQSVIEFGHPLPGIVERLIIQMVEKKEVDVLKAYLACNYNKHEIILDNVKELVESRNQTFMNAAHDLAKLNDGGLKIFCEFFTLKTEPVPMDIE